ncbi:serine O-acetyltransferase EpsC [Albibacterium bauzanense]|uniref:Serine acetyltransferase n=1 Tax=Albibacterium bauzanense TaxID=653929 RepID=A0A4R1M7P0_9SPHI|nr:serine O-acetyltransferase EpsC [Albibacterium bauzanense]TCK85713.1 serine O-acetyltransferase [Albibacterium bauzanense]
MNEDFYRHILEKQVNVQAVPSNQVIADWVYNLLNLVFPERSVSHQFSLNDIKESFSNLEKELVQLLNATKACSDCNNELVAETFFKEFPALYDKMNTDISAILNGDPAAKSEFEIIRTYPGFLAISFYRIAHALLKLDVPLIPRILTELAHSKTGIDIHPGAVIGEYLYIDHGTGIVIGETTIIGKHVKIYQGVTLGGLSVEKLFANTKRHPTIEDHVVLYAGATILGGDTVVGHSCIIGGNVWLTKSVPPNSTVYHQSTVKVIDTKDRIQ